MNTEYKPCQVDLLARAMYQKECDYVGPNHDQFCIEQNKQVLQSFEAEIERLTTEVSNARTQFNTELETNDRLRAENRKLEQKLHITEQAMDSYMAEAANLREVITEMEASND